MPEACHYLKIICLHFIYSLKKCFHWRHLIDQTKKIIFAHTKTEPSPSHWLTTRLTAVAELSLNFCSPAKRKCVHRKKNTSFTTTTKICSQAECIHFSLDCGHSMSRGCLMVSRTLVWTKKVHPHRSSLSSKQYKVAVWTCVLLFFFFFFLNPFFTTVPTTVPLSSYLLLCACLCVHSKVSHEN